MAWKPSIFEERERGREGEREREGHANFLMCIVLKAQEI